MNWSADGGPELVALQRGLHEDGGAEQEAGGVQIGVAQELVGRAVKLVGSGFHDGVDHRAAHAPVFGAVVAGDHFELGKRVRRRLHQLGGIALVAGPVGIVVQAVQQKVVIGAAHAVYVEGAFARRAAGREGGRDRRLDGVGGQQRQVRIIAAVEREFRDRRRADHLAVFAGIGLQRGGHAGDLDGFRDGADLHGNIHALAGVHVDRHVRGGELRKSRLLHDQGVAANLHVEEIVVPVFVGRDLGLNPRVLRWSASQSALGIAPPDASLTVPRTSAVSNCPKSKGAQRTHPKNIMRVRRSFIVV